MNIIFGAGHLGKFLNKHLDNSELIDGDIFKIKKLPDYHINCVINTIGKTDLTWCEDYPKEAFESNAQAPYYISNLIYEYGSEHGYLPIFIHISSGCIWTGPYDNNNEPFDPSSKPSPACYYSWTKVAGESMLYHHSRVPYCILRPRQIYSDVDSDRNTLNKLVRYEKLINTPNSMTSAYTILKTVNKIVDIDLQGFNIFNVYDRGVATPFEVGNILADIGLRDIPIETSKSDLDVWHKPRRVDVVMRDVNFESFIDPPEIKDEITRVAKLWKTLHIH